MQLRRRRFIHLATSTLGTAATTACAARRPELEGDGTGDEDATGTSTPGDLDPAGGEGEGGSDAGTDGEVPEGREPLHIPDLLARTPASVCRSSREELDVELQVLDGSVPRDIHGHWFMVGPMPWQDGTFIVNGDGMAYRLDFGDDRVRLKTRLLRTPCFYAERASVGTEHAFQSTGGGPARMSTSLGVRNQANTALVPMGRDRLLATYDGGRPFEIDPVSLEVVTPVGYHHEWAPALDFSSLPIDVVGSVFPVVFSSAHPSFDPHTQELFSVCYGQGGLEILGMNVGGDVFTRLMRWPGHGPLTHWNLVDPSGQPVMITQSAHQMQVTERYVVIQDSAFRIEATKTFDPAAFEPQAQQTILWVIERSDLDATSPGGTVVARRFTLPRESPHFLADYENPGGRLTVHVVHNAAYDASEWLRPGELEHGSGREVRADLLGMLTGTSDLNHVGRYVIDVNGRGVLPGEVRLMKDDDLTWAITLYTHRGTWAPGRHETHYWVSSGFASDLLTRSMAEAYADHPHREVPLSALPFDEGRPAALFRCDPTSGLIVDGYPFPAGRLASSPQFVPRAGSTGPTDGYVVCTVVSDDVDTPGSSGDEIWIFDAADLSRGPRCRLGHRELNMAFTLHTTWLPEIAPRTAPYRVDVVLDHDAEVSRLGDDVQHIFAQDVYPHFL